MLPHNHLTTKQITPVWHEIRDGSSVSGSTLFKACGLGLLREQQEHFHKVFKDINQQWNQTSKSYSIVVLKKNQMHWRPWWERFYPFTSRHSNTLKMVAMSYRWKMGILLSVVMAVDWMMTYSVKSLLKWNVLNLARPTHQTSIIDFLCSIPLRFWARWRQNAAIRLPTFVTPQRVALLFKESSMRNVGILSGSIYRVSTAYHIQCGHRKNTPMHQWYATASIITAQTAHLWLNFHLYYIGHALAHQQTMNTMHGVHIMTSSTAHWISTCVIWPIALLQLCKTWQMHEISFEDRPKRYWLRLCQIWTDLESFKVMHHMQYLFSMVYLATASNDLSKGLHRGCIPYLSNKGSERCSYSIWWPVPGSRIVKSWWKSFDIMSPKEVILECTTENSKSWKAVHTPGN